MSDDPLKNAKIGRGCGGCGCVFALLTLIGGVVLVAFGTQRATREAMPFGVITTGLAVPIGLVSAGILIWALMAISKGRQAS